MAVAPYSPQQTWERYKSSQRLSAGQRISLLHFTLCFRQTRLYFVLKKKLKKGQADMGPIGEINEYWTEWSHVWEQCWLCSVVQNTVMADLYRKRTFFFFASQTRTRSGLRSPGLTSSQFLHKAIVYSSVLRSANWVFRRGLKGEKILHIKVCLQGLGSTAYGKKRCTKPFVPSEGPV